MAATATEGQHFDLDELTRLAAAFRKHGEAWEMPGHLSRCPLCLEAFEVVIEGLPAPSSNALSRFVEIGRAPDTSPNTLPFPSCWRGVLKIAAAFALLFGAVWLLQQFGRTTSGHVREGTLALANGNTLAAGEAIPGGVSVTAIRPCSAEFVDGSKVKLGKDAIVSFGQTFGGATTIALNEGEVVASVAKQEGGKRFTVKTPLGEVTVVGTRFRVTCQKEEVTVYQSVAGQSTEPRRDLVRAVRVAVFEGIVRVRRLKEEALVNANQTAVLRENEPGIEVSGERQ